MYLSAGTLIVVGFVVFSAGTLFGVCIMAFLAAGKNN